MGTFPFAHKLAHLDSYFKAMQAKHEREYLDQPKQAAGATAGGDERRLRGIPAIGRGVQGAITGTRPDSITDETAA